MRELPVDLDQIALGMSEDPDVGTWYLDTETGETFLLGTEMQLDEDEEDPPDWLDDHTINAWREISHGDPRWKEIPQSSSHEQWQVMARFVDTVDDEVLRTRLQDALDGRGAFSRFRRVLSEYPAEQKRWRAFEDEDGRREARLWLESLGIRAMPRPGPEGFSEP